MNNFWTTLPQPILALAPMEGVTDSAFRQLCREHRADVVYTEFMSSDAIGHQAKTVLEKMSFDPSEQPVVCQIFGHDLNMFRAAAREIQARGFSGLDINLGCPARKVVGHGSGAALLRDPAFARQLIEAVLEEVSIPVSLKVRASIRKEQRHIAPDAEKVTALDLVEAIRDLPVAAIMVHGRSYEGGFSGTVDTEMIRQVRERFSGLVLANGGIQKPEDAQKMLQETGAQGVGVARGALGRPWIFQEISELIKTGQYQPLAQSKVKKAILRHAQLAAAAKGKWGIIELRKHLTWYIRDFPGAADWRRRAVRVNTLEDVTELIERIP